MNDWILTDWIMSIPNWVLFVAFGIACVLGLYASGWIFRGKAYWDLARRIGKARKLEGGK